MIRMKHGSGYVYFVCIHNTNFIIPRTEKIQNGGEIAALSTLFVLWIYRLNDYLLRIMTEEQQIRLNLLHNLLNAGD